VRGQAGFGAGAFDQLIAQGFDVGGDGFKQRGAICQGGFAVSVERGPRQCAGLVDVLLIPASVGGFPWGVGSGVDGPDRIAMAANRLLTDQHLACQSHGDILENRGVL